MFKHIDYIYEIYMERSFTKAAEKLYVSQPALSLAVKKLEAELGYPIFERYGKAIVPTVYGEKYIEAIKEIKRIQANLENEIADMTEMRAGKISIGSTTFISLYILPDILKEFKTKYPNIDIELSVDQSTVLKEKLENGELDAIIDNAACFCEGLAYEPLFEEKILFGVPRDFKINKSMTEYALNTRARKNKIASFPKLDIARLVEEKFILLKNGNSMREITDKMFAEAGITPEVNMEFDLLLSAIGYAEHGFGVCTLTDTVLKIREVDLVLYSPDSLFSKRTVYIISKDNKYLSRAAREFIRITKERVNNEF